MAIPNPEHFFEQADRLISIPSVGSPRQVDLRRAISGAYYGLFHFTLTVLADEFVGVTYRTTSRYELIYRSIDHRTFRDLCVEVQKSTPASRYRTFVPSNGFGPNIEWFASAAVELQEKRHGADYSPALKFKTSDASFAVSAARRATNRFGRASADQRKTFLTLLLCPPR